MSEPTNDVRERLQETARAVQSILPPHTGFVVLAFDLQFNPDSTPGRIEYISNGRREDVIKAMKEFIEKTELNWAQHV